VDFSFSDDQVMFRDAVSDLLSKECPPEAVRAAWENDTGRTSGLWEALAEMGVVGMTAPTSAGGLGMDETDLVLLLEEAGRAALRVVEGGEITHRVETELNCFAGMLGGEDRRRLFLVTAPGSHPDEVQGLGQGRIESVPVEIPGAGRP